MTILETRRKMVKNAEGQLVPVGDPKDPPNEENSEWVNVVYDPLGKDNPVPVGSIIRPYICIEPVHEDGVSSGPIVYWGDKAKPEAIYVEFKGSGNGMDETVGNSIFATGSYDNRSKRERESKGDPNPAPAIGTPAGDPASEPDAKRQCGEPDSNTSPEELEAARAKIEEQRKADIDRVAKEMDEDTSEAGVEEDTHTPTGDEPETTAMEDDPADDEEANTEEF